MDKTLINCIGNMVNDESFSLDSLQAIDVAELTSHLMKSGIPQ